ncbi:MAG: restriction endonuclease subunit S [Dehalococcoidia bacterium]|nr:restriction endonuclease subunit S [Dehalococcoidia bacterium]
MKRTTIQLGDFLTLKRGYDLPEHARLPGEIPVVSSSGITGTHKEAKVDGPGVVTGRYGTLGEVFYIEEPFWPLNTALYVQDFKGNHRRFVSYFLKWVLNGTQSDKAAVPGVNRNDLHARKVGVPEDIGEQALISSILSAYDDLIENNRRRIELLEQSARLLYKEWFVNLRFPGHEHTQIIDGVPEGWEKTTIGESASFISRGITPKYDDDAPGIVINQKCIRNRMVNLDFARRQSKQVPPGKLVQFGDVLINSTGAGTLGRVAQLLFEIDECTVDSHVTIVRPKEGVPVYYFGLHLTGLESYVATLGRGATNQTELSKDDIAALEIVLPSSSSAQIFESIVAPSFRQIRVLSEQIERLIKARDLLLPKLMNGEVAV